MVVRLPCRPITVRNLAQGNWTTWCIICRTLVPLQRRRHTQPKKIRSVVKTHMTGSTTMKKSILRFFVLTLLCTVTSLAQQAGRKFSIQADSSALWNLIDHDAKLATVATGFGFTEGPMWHPKGFVYVSDETLNKI